MLPLDMVTSEAYRKLSKSALRVLPIFIRKSGHTYKKPEHYLTVFHFTYTEAKNLCGMAERTFYDAIRNLIKWGFIEQVKQGGVKGGDKVMSTFKLSDQWKQKHA